MNKSLLIEAGPGAGKTTTVGYITTYLNATNKEVWYKQHKRLTDEQLNILRWCDENLPSQGSIIGMAYNKEAAEQLKTKVHKSVECRSVHGWGYKIVQKHYHGYLPVNEGCVLSIIEKLTGRPLNSLPNKYQWLAAARYFEKLKDELLDPTPENLIYLSQKYEDLAAFKWDQTTSEFIKRILPEAKKPDKKRGIQFVDQVWLACFILAKSEPMFDIAIIDECQDLSAARRFVADKIAKHKIWIGDRYQAINAFAGADARSMDRIIDLKPDTLPLKTSFRNPPNIIRKLNDLFPLAQLQGLDKPDGIEKRIELEDYPNYVRDSPTSTLTLSRTNAPLIQAAYKLLEANIPCRILGDRAVDQLCTIIKKQMAPTMEQFRKNLLKYETIITNGLDEYVADLFRDKIRCIKLVMDRVSAPEEIAAELRRLFKPSEGATLCTIHKGKGLEAASVFILFPPIESPLARTPDQKEQERDLRYVAESRTSRDLYWVV